MADNKKMTVAEMLAAARAEKAKKDAGSAPAAESAPTPEPTVPAAPGISETASAAPIKPADAKKMTVAEMMAAARAEKAAGAKPAAAAAKAEAPAAAKPVAAKATPATKAAAAAKEPTAVSSSAEKDTGSILAAARKTAKPGPISKTEAPTEKAKPVKEKLAVPPMPEKPGYARPRPAAAAAAAATDRRGFMAMLFGSSLAIGFTSLAVTNLLWVLGLARFMFPNVLIEPPTRFKVGFLDDFSPGQVSEKYKAQFGTWIVRYEYEGQPMIYALKTVCTHLGCTPNWLEGEQKFKCPCHGSGFYKDGINFEGPAPRPLERYALSLADDGQLQVDKSATFHEETGQWADPASFVPV
jgi:cytochrome b6-f complex iron-sulfur subunit